MERQMQCELCGNDCGPHGRPALVDGVRMILCPACLKHGKHIKEVQGVPVNVEKSLRRRQMRKTQKDVYEGMNRELISDWNDTIRQAREKIGLTREQLGFNIGERTVTISKIENGELRPSDKVAEKLEKELHIKLFEEVKKVTPSSISSGSHGLTLGDFIKKEE